MKSVTYITDPAIIKTLQQTCRHGSTPYLRESAHAILLSHRGYALGQIANLLAVQYQTISGWTDQWEDHGILGLYKSHGGGANAIFNTEEVERFKELVKDEPHRIRHAKAVLEKETEKKFSEYHEENG